MGMLVQSQARLERGAPHRPWVDRGRWEDWRRDGSRAIPLDRREPMFPKDRQLDGDQSERIVRHESARLFPSVASTLMRLVGIVRQAGVVVARIFAASLLVADLLLRAHGRAGIAHAASGDRLSDAGEADRCGDYRDNREIAHVKHS